MSCPLPCPLPYQLVHLSGRRAPAESLCHQKWNLPLNLASHSDDERVSGLGYFSSAFDKFLSSCLAIFKNTPPGSSFHQRFIVGLR